MLIDAISFFNELDILEIRLGELNHMVDRFVIVEATRTHKGELKPLYYAENKQRFAEWEHKIKHVIVGDMPQGDGLAAIRRREMFQRNGILRGIADCADDDIVLISDADEIPRIEAVAALRDGLDDGMVVVCMQKLYYFNVNTHAPTRPWPGTRACRVADARALSPHIVRNGMGQPDAYYPRYVMLERGGWHYSYFGDAAHIQNKMTQFLHQELVTDENTALDAIADRVARGEDIWGRTNEQKFEIGPADDLPYIVLRDLEKWGRLFAPNWAPVFHEKWYNGGQAIYAADFARQAPQQGAIVEIGCWEGRSTIVLAQILAPRTVVAIDHWRGNPDEGADHPATVAAQERDVFSTFLHNNYVLTNNAIHPMRFDWRDWIELWKDGGEPIAFVHLDAAHDYQSVYDCLQAIKPFLLPGAILCGDDGYAESVITAVRDALGDIELIGERLWVKRWEGN